MAVHVSQELRRLAPQLRYEPTPKRLRARLGDTPVLDSRRAVVLWEPNRFLPLYAVPEDDVLARLEPLGAGDVPSPPPDPPSSPVPFSPHTADGERLTVVVSGADGGTRLGDAAFRLADPDLAGYIAFDTDAFSWLEEDEPVLGHPRDPFSRIDMRATSAQMRVELAGVVLAESSQTVRLFEGRLPPRTYFPADGVRWDRLAKDPLRTICPYKGVAVYWRAPGLDDGRPVAWSYGPPEPSFPEMAQIHGRIAFFDERVDTFADGEPVQRPRTAWT
ncbi:hypothetical protein GCM10012320_30310 [Sinomonas cellulolyticus]|uniref:DUF427 domain-containing protein n=1 Tax=Sinomonas cellulolyticus TaxID=2801916 RepID=A0ABS1JY62_9MICC|nr:MULTISPECIES: DUF427 domain-containing protein [Sinomonas]MBL0704138.1 DUF427 domain-containing protein [Sinomonas cellulolyticus]GHG57284.1 hypothetical protein GCM10012320_30310 [Sinomonas sp. KCTC 49339]